MKVSKTTTGLDSAGKWQVTNRSYSSEKLAEKLRRQSLLTESQPETRIPPHKSHLNFPEVRPHPDQLSPTGSGKVSELPKSTSSKIEQQTTKKSKKNECNKTKATTSTKFSQTKD